VYDHVQETPDERAEDGYDGYDEGGGHPHHLVCCHESLENVHAMRMKKGE
jgi:hypothetical protein